MKCVTVYRVPLYGKAFKYERHEVSNSDSI